MPKDTPTPKRLKEARKAKLLSQKQLGMAAGFDQFSASSRQNQYETGKHTPDYLTVENLAKVLKTPTSYFYERDDKLAEIIKTYGMLKSQARIKALKLIKELLKSDEDTSSSESSV